MIVSNFLLQDLNNTFALLKAETVDGLDRIEAETLQQLMEVVLPSFNVTVFEAAANLVFNMSIVLINRVCDTGETLTLAQNTTGVAFNPAATLAISNQQDVLCHQDDQSNIFVLASSIVGAIIAVMFILYCTRWSFRNGCCHVRVDIPEQEFMLDKVSNKTLLLAADARTNERIEMLSVSLTFANQSKPSETPSVIVEQT